MRILMSFILLMSYSLISAQDLEVEGKAKIHDLSKVERADSMVVVLPDGSLGVMEISAIQKMIDQAILNFGIASGQKGIQALVEAGYNSKDIYDAGAKVQSLLDVGLKPLDIVAAGIPKDSLYGKSFGGGLIFYLDDLNLLPDIDGMVAAPFDQSSAAELGCYAGPSLGNDPLPESIGFGAANTMVFVGTCPNSAPAASLCDTLDLNGFTDWFLPSKEELNEMYQKIGPGASGSNQNLGGFSSDAYWSSSNVNFELAWAQIFFDGEQLLGTRDQINGVRAVRNF